MAGQSALAFLWAVLGAIAVVLGAVIAAAAAALVMATTLMAVSLAERLMPDIQPLAALALTPNQAMLMAALQAGGLSTITEFMQQVNLVMITATL
jgi:hypothetical protein